MLNSLEIKNFRLLENFKVEKLGRVNLIVGKNNSGKSAVLEALRIYADCAFKKLLTEIAKSHDETYQMGGTKHDGFVSSMPFEDLFTGRQLPDDETNIVIGESEDDEQALKIGYRILIDVEELKLDTNKPFVTVRSDSSKEHTKSQYLDLIEQRSADFGTKSDFGTKAEILSISKNKKSIAIFLGDESFNPHSYFYHKLLGITQYSFIPTQLVATDELAEEWDKIVFTEHEEIVKQAMRIISPDFENLTFVGEQFKRLAKVKLANAPRPIPIKSLGDGMVRVLQLALKMVSAKNGFLLIDEFENGLHYSTQEKIWALLFEMAEHLNIQVFATTHSWDCIESFAKVAKYNETTEGVLFRMGKSARKSNYGQVIATVFDKEELYNITQADVEVR